MDELYKKYAKLVYSYTYGLCRNHDIAEELTQETFYKAIKGINKFKQDCKIITWLYRIAKNTWIDFLRREKRKKFISIDDNIYYIERAVLANLLEESIEDSEENINLYQSINKLDEVTKRVFYLKLTKDISFKEIGEILGRSESWARIIFYRGKIKLREVMRNNEK